MVAILVLLDLSAAFDTIDHQLLVQRLGVRCGVTCESEKWFASSHPAVAGAVRRAKTVLWCAQVYVLRPLVFISYTTPIGDIARRHEVKLQLYADDIQLYLPFNPFSAEDTNNAIYQLQAGIAEMLDGAEQTEIE